MDHDRRRVEIEPDDFERVARSVAADRAHVRWVAVRFEVDDHDRMFNRMCDGLLVLVDAVSAGRPVDPRIQ